MQTHIRFGSGSVPKRLQLRRAEPNRRCQNMIWYLDGAHSRRLRGHDEWLFFVVLTISTMNKSWHSRKTVQIMHRTGKNTRTPTLFACVPPDCAAFFYQWSYFSPLWPMGTTFRTNYFTLRLCVRSLHHSRLNSSTQETWQPRCCPDSAQPSAGGGRAP